MSNCPVCKCKAQAEALVAKMKDSDLLRLDEAIRRNIDVTADRNDLRRILVEVAIR